MGEMNGFLDGSPRKQQLDRIPTSPLSPDPLFGVADDVEIRATPLRTLGRQKLGWNDDAIALVNTHQ